MESGATWDVHGIRKGRRCFPRQGDAGPLPRMVEPASHRAGHPCGEGPPVSGRRRFVDPTTCERDYSTAEMEFMLAMTEYKHKSGRMFPTWSEVLEVLHAWATRSCRKPPASTEPILRPVPATGQAMGPTVSLGRRDVPESSPRQLETCSQYGRHEKPPKEADDFSAGHHR